MKFQTHPKDEISKFVLNLLKILSMNQFLKLNFQIIKTQSFANLFMSRILFLLLWTILNY